jgi:hypothetical protein
MGIHLLDNCALNALAEACATRSRWTFMLAVAPLVLERGTASPVNPLAMFWLFWVSGGQIHERTASGSG